jgi:hypothetical protein
MRKTMKILRLALLALLLCGAAIDSAHAGIHVGGSHSAAAFKSGFASQKKTFGQATSEAGAKKSTFGSFGANPDAPSPAAPSSGSALSRDLSTTGANTAALKTFDARNQAQPTATSYAPNPAANAATNPPIYPANLPGAPQTVIVQHSGFSSSPFLWFMLGHALTGNDRDRVVYVNANGADGQNGNIAPANADTGAIVAQPQESPAAVLLRIVLWTAILSAAICGAVYYFARRSAKAVKHYSL